MEQLTQVIRVHGPELGEPLVPQVHPLLLHISLHLKEMPSNIQRKKYRLKFLKIKFGASKAPSGQIDRLESSINATALFFSPNAICFNFFKFDLEFLKGAQNYLLLYTKIHPIPSFC
jgi:hypothetical protein